MREGLYNPLSEDKVDVLIRSVDVSTRPDEAKSNNLSIRVLLFELVKERN